jgi:hypothetical protein
MIARILGILIDLPFSTTVMGFRNSSLIKVLRFFEPLRRPFGLPDLPFWNWLCFGGLQLPTSYEPKVDTASCSLLMLMT